MSDHHSSAKDKLLEIIKAKKMGKAIPTASSSKPSSTPSKRIKPQRGKINSYKANALIVVPNRRISLNIENIFKTLKISALSVDSGEAALEKVQENAYKIILVEKEQPDISGFNLCTKIRAEENGREAKIIITSHSRDPNMKMQAQMVDADDYLPQPVSIAEVTAMIKELLGDNSGSLTKDA